MEKWVGVRLLAKVCNTLRTADVHIAYAVLKMHLLFMISVYQFNLTYKMF